MPLFADLLHSEARLSVDPAALGQALTFAFAAGSSSDDFDRLLNSARIETGKFRPECFAKDLFLTDLVGRCITLRIKNRERSFHRAQLVRVLSQPPTELAEVQFRQAILSELDGNAELRKSLEKAWLQIAEVTNRLETTERGKRYDPAARRIDILRDIKYALDLLDSGFSGATSGLSRVAVFGRSVRAGKAYRDLSALLDHEEHLATVDLRVRLGQDGRLRGFEITEARENVDNPFHIAPLQRWLSRVKMWLRGYRVREGELVGRIANHVFDQLQATVVALLELGLHFEFYLAALALRDRAGAAGLAMCLPEFVDASQREPGHIKGLFNPLLLLEGKTPVPCDLTPGASSLVVITGPNSGGKTRLLEAIGLTQLLGQAGMFVPAESARLCIRDGLFVSLLQETTADQPEGRLGMELLRIRRMFERLEFNSLVILDELCSGTNPSEGEGIFQLVVGLLAELEPQAYITTHFLEFAARLARERPVAGLEFLQVELDANNDPTYGFVKGVAPTSLAGRTAERLGVTREALEGLVRQKKRQQRPSLPPLAEAPSGGVKASLKPSLE